MSALVDKDLPVSDIPTFIDLSGSPANRHLILDWPKVGFLAVVAVVFVAVAITDRPPCFRYREIIS